MRTSCVLAAFLVLHLFAPAAIAGSSPVGVVVRDGAEADWPGALVMKDILQNPVIVGLLPEGTQVYILQHLSNKVYTYVVADGIRGWVKIQYIKELPGVSRRSRAAGVHRPVIFDDVPGDHWARQAVERMVKAGLIEKHGDRFMGSKPVTRYELAVVLDRANRRAEQSRESIEARIKALESVPPAAGSGTGGQYKHLMSLAQTLRSLQSQSEELRGRLDALDTGGGHDMTRRLRILEHRLDVIERSLGNG